MFYLAVAATGLVLFGFFIFNFSKNQMIQIRGDELQALAALKKRDLINVSEAWRDRLRLIASRTRFRKLLSQHLVTPEVSNVKGMTKIMNDAVRSVSSVRQLSLFSPSGSRILSVGEQISGTETCNINEVMQRRSVLISRIWMGAGSKVYAKLCGPVELNGKVLGVLLGIIDAHELTSIAKSYIGLGKTGETTIAERNENGDARFLTPLRYAKNEGLRIIVPKESTQVPISLALQKKQIYLFGLENIDYRGVPVLSATAYIPELDWGVVTKINRDDALFPLTVLVQKLVVFGLAIMLVILTIGSIVSRTFATPIEKLRSAALRISDGDFGHRVEISGVAEIGKLAEAFNIMLSSLEERTLQLEESEAQQDQLITMLMKSNSELDDFAHIAAHDLKEPLRAIHNHVSFLLEDYEDKLDEDGQKKLNRLKSLSKRMEKLISDLLHFSLLNKQGLAVKDTDLNTVLSDLMDTLYDSLEEKNVEIFIPNPLPVINCDAVRIGELFRNLITNSIKYNENYEKLIEIGCTDKNEKVFYLKDNGIGIEPEHQADIFKIFKRLHNEKKYGVGTGAGLTFVKKIVETHGGRIWVESDGKNGTTFFFTLEAPGEQVAMAV